jgi:hypothetical protein
MMDSRHLKLLASAALMLIAAPVPVTAQEGSFQGMSLLGERMVTGPARTSRRPKRSNVRRATPGRRSRRI